ncbi:hypothetical protein [Acidiphilium acidophilum]|uniref:hypothetical protein n=1 Tax=Acidiphilium acidophilum TaxID=76588 RepID=UPI002E8E68AC|nr:hypothetical protein [Acidiphilium acidophilum]
MRKLIQTMTLIAAVGALAPMAGQAGQARLAMYQPGPLIVHTPHHARMARKAAPTQARVATNSGQTDLGIYQPYPVSTATAS